MANDVEISQLLKDLFSQSDSDKEATEEFRVALNAIIAKYKLPPAVVISLLARMSAAYIHLTQRYYNKLGADVVVEEDFQNMLEAQLTDLDMSDIGNEIEKIKNLEVN